MHPITDPSSRLDSLRSLVNRAVPRHGAIALMVVEKERIRDNVGRAYRIEEMRLLLADGSEWLIPKSKVPMYENSMTLPAAAWDLYRERHSRTMLHCWTMVRSPCLA